MSTEELKDAERDLKEYLEQDEVVEALVFGDWGRGGYGEKEVFVPLDKKGVVLTFDEAMPYMHGWSFYGGLGAAKCYAVRIWTNKRVIWVTQYDGSTILDSAPRNPIAHVPDMPGR